MPAVHQLHVVTYVWRPGDKEPDIGAHQVLQNPADVKAGVEGDATKVVVSEAANFQCHGEAGTDNCEKCHPHAQERVIARLIDGDRVAVAWRKYHPMAARATITPGVPFEAEHDGVKIRVEARLVTAEAGNVMTEKALSPVALRAFEADLTQKQVRTQQRDAARKAVSAFVLGPLEQHRVHVDAIAERTKDIPGAADAFAPVYAALAGLAALVQRTLDDELARIDGPKDARVPAGHVLAQDIATQTAKLAAIVYPATLFEQAAQDLVNAQVEIRKTIDAIAAVDARVAVSAIRFAGLDFNALPEIDLYKRADALLKASKTKAGFTAARATKELKTLSAACDARSAALDGAVAVQDEKKRAFDGRVEMLTSLKDGRLKAQVCDYVEACGCAPGFNTKHWTQTLGDAVDAAAKKAPAVPALSYHLAQDEKTLAALEAKVDTLSNAVALVDADFKKRMEPNPVHVVAGLQFTPPSAWVKATAFHDDGTVDMTVNITNNGAHAMVVTVTHPDEEAPLQTIALAQKGDRATFTLEAAKNGIGFAVTAVGPACPRAGAAVLTSCKVTAGETLRLNGVGAVRHMPALYFTPDPRHRGRQVNHVFANVPDVVISQQRLPGGR